MSTRKLVSSLRPSSVPYRLRSAVPQPLAVAPVIRKKSQFARIADLSRPWYATSQSLEPCLAPATLPPQHGRPFSRSPRGMALLYLPLPLPDGCSLQASGPASQYALPEPADRDPIVPQLREISLNISDIAISVLEMTHSTTAPYVLYRGI